MRELVCPPAISSPGRCITRHVLKRSKRNGILRDSPLADGDDEAQARAPDAVPPSQPVLLCRIGFPQVGQRCRAIGEQRTGYEWQCPSTSRLRQSLRWSGAIAIYLRDLFQIIIRP